MLIASDEYMYTYVSKKHEATASCYFAGVYKSVCEPLKL